MRIQSKFQDYYDSGIAYGFDEKIVYERTRREIVNTRVANDPSPDWKEATKHILPIMEGHRFSGNRYEVTLPNLTIRKAFMPWATYSAERGTSRGVVFFCGRMYPFYVASIQVYPDPTKPPPSVVVEKKYEDTFLWDEGFDEMVEQSRWDVKFYGDWKDKVAQLTGKDSPVNEQFRSPVVVYLYDTVIIDACLKDYRFHKVIKPYAAFQEIGMYLGTMLYPEAPPAPQSDKEKVVSHGLDPKYGFRKTKQA